MATEYQSFAGGDQDPWTSIPSGWSVVGGAFRRLASYGSGEIINKAGGSSSRLLFNTYSAGYRKISSTMKYRTPSGGSYWALCFLTSSSNGFTCIITSTTITIRKDLAGADNGTIATVSLSNTADADFDLEYNDSTGAINLNKNGSSVLTGNYTDTPNLLAGIRSFNAGIANSFPSVTVEYTPAYSVTSINGGSAFTASQTSSSAVTAGFTGLPSSITATWGAYSIPISGIGGSTNAPTFTKAVRVDGNVYPKNGESLTLTFTNGSETASGTQTFNKDADDVEIEVSAPIINDPKYLFGAIFDATGRTAVTGDYGYYKVPPAMSDLTIDSDGRIQTTNAGTFQYWAYTAATAVNYYYSVTVSSGGDVVSIGLTSAGLTSSGLTRTGLTSAGL